jgi:hypothetical protein
VEHETYQAHCYLFPCICLLYDERGRYTLWQIHCAAPGFHWKGSIFHCIWSPGNYLYFITEYCIKCVRLPHYCLQTLATIYACPQCTVQSLWAVFRNAIYRLHSVLSIVTVGRISTWWLKISQPSLLKSLTMKLIVKGALQCWNLNIRHDISFYSVMNSGDFFISHVHWV